MNSAERRNTGDSLLNLELAETIRRQFQLPGGAFLEDLAPAPRILGIGALERKILLARRKDAVAKYPQWFQFWQSPHRIQQFAELQRVIGRVYKDIIANKQKERKTNRRSKNFTYKPTIQDVRDLSFEMLASIHRVSPEDALFLKAAFGDASTEATTA